MRDEHGVEIEYVGMGIGGTFDQTCISSGLLWHGFALLGPPEWGSRPSQVKGTLAMACLYGNT